MVVAPAGRGPTRFGPSQPEVDLPEEKVRVAAREGCGPSYWIGLAGMS